MTFYEQFKSRCWDNLNTIIITAHCYLITNIIVRRYKGEPLPLCSRPELVGYFLGGIIALVLISAFQVYVERKYPSND